jgi:hypothetical protein
MRWKASAAFTDPEAAFTEIPMGPMPIRFTIEIEVKRMRLLPMMLILVGTLLMMGRFQVIEIAPYQAFWPVSLIVAGLEELYVWARSGKNR